jgi:isopenicillin N synthase-like dioxygenase
MATIRKLPVIDIAPLLAGTSGQPDVARKIAAACRDTGFFYISGHGVTPATIARLDEVARTFFDLPHDEKMKIAMARGGRAWRGFFPVGGELTSGKPDLKEGVYFGTELGPNDPRVKAGVPMHGQNLWPESPVDLKPAVLAFMAETTRAAHAVMRGVALSLSLDEDYFARTYTAEPTVLFRVFHYPPARAVDGEWGVGEHTDYGLLTLLAQDDCGGLQVKGQGGWIEAPPIPALDRRILALNAAPGAQRLGARPAVVSAVLRSRVRCGDRAVAGAREKRPRRQRRTLGPRERARV